jgi:2-dehydro-3-deoxygalactonokinase
MAHDPAAFDAGARDGLDNGHALPRRLFGVRTRGLFGTLTPQAAPSLLSGLLIGAEVRAARESGGAGHGASGVTLIGEPVLCQRYARVLEMAGIAARSAEADVTPRGLWLLARAAGMIGA